jgi:MFS_1 like family
MKGKGFPTLPQVTLYPYLIVHLRSLGFTIEDASIVNTAVPLADIVAPPLAGLLVSLS